MVDRDPALYRSMEDVSVPEEAIAKANGRPGDTWYRWFGWVPFLFNENFQSAGASDTSTSDGGRIAALEERVKQVEGVEGRLLAVAAQIQQDIASVAATPAPAHDAPPVYVPPAAVLVIDGVTADQLANRIAALESAAAVPQPVGQIEQQMQQIAEAVVADAIGQMPAFDLTPPDNLGAAPAVELGQLFKGRTYTQLVPLSTMYLPTTQPAAGPNMYETVVGGSAFQCWEFAPGTLAADNDNVEFLLTPPEGWTGGPLQVRFIWTHAATVTNFLVAWSCIAQQYQDAGSGTGAFSGEVVVQDVGGITNAIYTSGTLALTPANVTAFTAVPAFPVLFKAKRRNQSESTVGLAVNARLVGLQVVWPLFAVAQT